MSWHNIGTIDNLVANSGVCALVNNQQVAIFYIPQNPTAVFATTRLAKPTYYRVALLAQSTIN